MSNNPVSWSFIPARIEELVIAHLKSEREDYIQRILKEKAGKEVEFRKANRALSSAQMCALKNEVATIKTMNQGSTHESYKRLQKQYDELHRKHQSLLSFHDDMSGQLETTTITLTVTEDYNYRKIFIERENIKIYKYR